VECAKLFRDVYAEEPLQVHWSLERALEYLLRIYHFDPDSCYIAEDKQQIIGAIFGYTFPWSSGTDLFIQELVVKREYRGRDIRESLITHVLDTISEETEVILVANKDSDMARFCERHGILQNTQYVFFSGKFIG
jgi:ribosomal protein S18 acetylase RimI-like enzyme